MNSLFDLTGKVAIVTGGTTGLGEAIAVGLAEAGADIVIVDILAGTETHDTIKNLGRKVLQITTDLSKMENINMVVNQTV